MRVRFGLGLRLVAREGEVEDREAGVGDRGGGCDDPLYKIRCNNSMQSLFFNALNVSSYPITSTTPPPSALSSAPPPSPPPPTSPLASTPRASSSTALSPSMSLVATPSCSSTTPLASSSAPSTPLPMTTPFAAPLSAAAPPPRMSFGPPTLGLVPTVTLSISMPWGCQWH